MNINENALHTAIANGNIEIVQLLLNDERINVNSTSIYVLNNIYGILVINLYGILLQYFNKKITPLGIAIEKGYLHIFHLLLQNEGINVNAIFIKIYNI